ncbi:MAG: PBSX family phage terminase large subunit [Gloeomargaritales cyanobacterium]
MPVKQLSRFQADSVRHANRRFNIAEGAVRSSKTVSMNLKWLRFVRSLENYSDNDAPLLMIGRTERTLKRNIIDPLTAILGKSRCKLNMGAGELHLLGRTIYIAGANNELSVSKIQGLTLMGAYGDEITTWPENVWRMLTNRLSLDDSKFFGTCNPDSPKHYLKENYLDKGRFYFDSEGGLVERPEVADSIDLVQLHYKLTDNPFLSESYVENLKRENKGLWRLRYIDGLWVIADGAIYSMFDPALHVMRKPRLLNTQHFVGVDYGTTNAFAALAIEVRPEGLHTFSELYIDKPYTDAELSKAFQEWLVFNDIRPSHICIDPSAASFRQQLYREGFTSLQKANNDVKYGLRRCASLLGSSLSTIDPSCYYLIGELPGYCWDSKKSLIGEDAPIKVNDHCCDAWRYGIITPEVLWRNRIAT